MKCEVDQSSVDEPCARDERSIRFLQGVESERCPSFSEALKAGKPVHAGAKPTLADGIISSSTFFQKLAQLTATLHSIKSDGVV